MPTDKASETDRWLKLRQILSDETVISNLPDNLDATSELEKVKEQNESEIQSNVNNINNKEYEVEDTDVGSTRQENEETETDISKTEQADTVETSRDNEKH